jgi:predicted DsbA family dithiol-disulfide isomerase
VEPVAKAYAKKFGGPEQAAAIIDRVTAVAETVGLDFAMDKALRANTLDAHRLLGYVLRTKGPVFQSMLKERLLRAYFSEGHNISDHVTLAALAADVDVDYDDALRFLSSGEGLHELAADLAEAVDAGITGVPHFVFDGRWSIPGAQDPELFLRAFRRIADLRRAESATEATDSTTCRVESGEPPSC